LVSVVVLLSLGYVLNFYGDCADILYVTVYYGSGYVSNGFMVLDIDYDQYNVNVDGCFSLIASSNNVEIDASTWHARLGHIGLQRMQRLAREDLLGSLTNVSLSVCEHYLAGKTTRKLFGKGTRVEFPLHFIHSDICGPLNVRARHGASYFITFIDYFTRFDYVFLISHKSEALDCFRRYIAMVENQWNKTIKALRTDRRHEYLSE